MAPPAAGIAVGIIIIIIVIELHLYNFYFMNSPDEIDVGNSTGTVLN